MVNKKINFFIAVILFTAWATVCRGGDKNSSDNKTTREKLDYVFNSTQTKEKLDVGKSLIIGKLKNSGVEGAELEKLIATAINELNERNYKYHKVLFKKNSELHFRSREISQENRAFVLSSVEKLQPEIECLNSRDDFVGMLKKLGFSQSEDVINSKLDEIGITNQHITTLKTLITDGPFIGQLTDAWIGYIESILQQLKAI
jgi:hypothetical protein